MNAVGTIEVGRVLHHIFITDFADGCSVSLGKGIVACKWIAWEELSSTMLKSNERIRFNVTVVSQALDALGRLAASQGTKRFWGTALKPLLDD